MQVGRFVCSFIVHRDVQELTCFTLLFSYSPNTAVEVYFQFGKDDNSSSAIQQRVLVDLLEHIIDEPMYNLIRTRGKYLHNLGGWFDV